ncbi:putative sterol desaturase [Vibrio nigripulchritudo ATCC 27043]|uniref:sterol desaturase family protein n=1 Tax=Vibrio nigripulchritudo TaxID=28173 RepID=UPI00021C1F82|nr:sterol desaturase family protein [Vibrio nigripulchritudo]EGU57665.1 putative sterol desaturase [Vibrio nigripulchritudo ATCC 27043]
MTKRTKEVVDEHGQVRDRRGEWRSGNPVFEEPVFVWPPKPKAFLKWFFGMPGYLFPWNLGYLIMTVIVMMYFTPELSRMETFATDWVVEILLRNIVLLFIVAGSLHLWLYSYKKQGRKFKYNGRWMAKNDSLFLFKDQVFDNMFWSIVSGCTIWTAYEVVLWWMYANSLLPYIDFQSNPVWFVLWLVLMPVWRLFHFYWIHRLIHWEPLYQRVHYLHHKNVNIGPWSGMAMHPVEHVLYFSCMLIHLIVPSHPFHMLFNGIHTGVTPAQGHSGFDEIVLGDEMSVKNAQIMHYMHHRYHTVNFGESIIPLDKWFGSFHNGSPEAEEAFRQSKRKARESNEKSAT